MTLDGAWPDPEKLSSSRHRTARDERTKSVLLAEKAAGRDRAENLVLVGPSGTGKSHFAEAIAHAAIDRDLRVSSRDAGRDDRPLAHRCLDPQGGRADRSLRAHRR